MNRAEPWFVRPLSRWASPRMVASGCPTPDPPDRSSHPCPPPPYSRQFTRSCASPPNVVVLAKVPFSAALAVASTSGGPWRRCGSERKAQEEEAQPGGSMVVLQTPRSNDERNPPHSIFSPRILANCWLSTGWLVPAYNSGRRWYIGGGVVGQFFCTVAGCLVPRLPHQPHLQVR
jgi:hypothetical protein